MIFWGVVPRYHTPSDGDHNTDDIDADDSDDDEDYSSNVKLRVPLY